jgi:hypothetical protein
MPHDKDPKEKPVVIPKKGIKSTTGNYSESSKSETRSKKPPKDPTITPDPAKLTKVHDRGSLKKTEENND